MKVSKSYDKAFKEKAVQLSYGKTNISKMARETGVTAPQLYKWRKVLETFNKLEEAYGFRILMPNGRPHPIQTLRLSEYISKYGITANEIISGSYLEGFSKV